MFLKSFVEGS